MNEVEFKSELMDMIINDDLGLLRDELVSDKERVLSLLKAQDLIRDVLCTESGQYYLELRKIDKQLSKAINLYK